MGKADAQQFGWPMEQHEVAVVQASDYDALAAECVRLREELERHYRDANEYIERTDKCLDNWERDNAALQQRCAVLEALPELYGEKYREAEGYVQALATLQQQHAALQQRCAEVEEGKGYLLRLWQLIAPQCEPLPTLAGLATQFDNYIAGRNQDINALQARLAQVEGALRDCIAAWEHEGEPSAIGYEVAVDKAKALLQARPASGGGHGQS
jgi:hypothetical protein